MHDMPAGLKFYMLHRVFRREMDAMMSEKGLTGVQGSVLGQLGRLEHCAPPGSEISQTDLERAAHMAHPTMTEVLKKLESKGYIRVAPSQTDRRRKVLYCTGKAATLHAEIEEIDRRVYERLTADMSTEQLSMLDSALEHMLTVACRDKKERK